MAIFRAKNTLLREEHGQMARAKRHSGKGPKDWGVGRIISSKRKKPRLDTGKNSTERNSKNYR
jgi:hypothetical protein